MIDFETTDVNPKECRIVQIAAVVGGGGGEFKTNVHADAPMTQGASTVTGITDEMLVGAPKIKEALGKLCEWLSNLPRPVSLCAYNGKRFDFIVLFSELLRAGIDVRAYMDTAGVTRLVDPYLIVCSPGFDTSKLFMNKHNKPSRRLGDVYKSLTGKTMDGAHDALNDCRGLDVVMLSEAYKNALDKANDAIKGDDVHAEYLRVRNECNRKRMRLDIIMDINLAKRRKPEDTDEPPSKKAKLPTNIQFKLPLPQPPAAPEAAPEAAPAGQEAAPEAAPAAQEATPEAPSEPAP